LKLPAAALSSSIARAKPAESRDSLARVRDTCREIPVISAATMAAL
jgi:hypothetical protein